MSKAELAKRTGLTEQHLNAIVKCKGKSAITPETAIKLERAIGMPVDYWLNLEANYQETQARLAEEAQLERDLDWLRKLPLKEMIKLSWLSERSDGKAQLIEVLRFSGLPALISGMTSGRDSRLLTDSTTSTRSALRLFQPGCARASWKQPVLTVPLTRGPPFVMR
ncbi:MAG: helix-turn-helix domain-containing protein [Thiocapsa sp.]|nr:MAG: helix-turn-helix domain-containing protein [Thiocapsa sp.]